MSRCLLCPAPATDGAHFPKHTGMGRRRRADDGLPRIPLCRECHDLLHAGDPDKTDLAIERAPGYWKRRGLWDQARPYFETFLARRRYLEDSSR